MFRNPSDIPAQLILDPSLPIPKGFGKKKLLQLQELREAYQWSMGKRFENAKLTDPEHVARLLVPIMAPLHKEHLIVVPCDSHNRPMAAPIPVAIGDVDGVDAGPRNILRSVLKCEGVGFFLAHNHPAGEVVPSAADRAVTRRLTEGARSVDLRFLDHLIIAPPDKWCSLQREDPSLFR